VNSACPDQCINELSSPTGCAVAEDYTYALERDKKQPRANRTSRSNKLISLREGLLSKSAASTGDAGAAAAASGLNSLTLSTATSSDMGSVLNAHDDGACLTCICKLHKAAANNNKMNGDARQLQGCSKIHCNYAYVYCWMQQPAVRAARPYN
jgi:hypothetical protein